MWAPLLVVLTALASPDEVSADAPYQPRFEVRAVTAYVFDERDAATRVDGPPLALGVAAGWRGAPFLLVQAQLTASGPARKVDLISSAYVHANGIVISPYLGLGFGFSQTLGVGLRPMAQLDGGTKYNAGDWTFGYGIAWAVQLSRFDRLRFEGLEGRLYLTAGRLF